MIIALYIFSLSGCQSHLLPNVVEVISRERCSGFSLLEKDVMIVINSIVEGKLKLRGIRVAGQE